jgi:hypothetical protein
MFYFISIEGQAPCANSLKVNKEQIHRSRMLDRENLFNRNNILILTEQDRCLLMSEKEAKII